MLPDPLAPTSPKGTESSAAASRACTVRARSRAASRRPHDSVTLARLPREGARQPHEPMAQDEAAAATTPLEVATHFPGSSGIRLPTDQTIAVSYTHLTLPTILRV